ncbi:MAG: hypothetical protein ACOCP8_01550 [archaeon]
MDLNILKENNIMFDISNDFYKYYKYIGHVVDTGEEFYYQLKSNNLSFLTLNEHDEFITQNNYNHIIHFGGLNSVINKLRQLININYSMNDIIENEFIQCVGGRVFKKLKFISKNKYLIDIDKKYNLNLITNINSFEDYINQLYLSVKEIKYEY